MTNTMIEVKEKGGGSVVHIVVPRKTRFFPSLACNPPAAGSTWALMSEHEFWMLADVFDGFEHPDCVMCEKCCKRAGLTPAEVLILNRLKVL